MCADKWFHKQPTLYNNNRCVLLTTGGVLGSPCTGAQDCGDGMECAVTGLNRTCRCSLRYVARQNGSCGMYSWDVFVLACVYHLMIISCYILYYVGWIEIIHVPFGKCGLTKGLRKSLCVWPQVLHLDSIAQGTRTVLIIWCAAKLHLALLLAPVFRDL